MASFNFPKILKGHHFIVGGLKNMKLPGISFDRDLQSCLLLFFTAILFTASNFNNS